MPTSLLLQFQLARISGRTELEVRIPAGAPTFMHSCNCCVDKVIGISRASSDHSRICKWLCLLVNACFSVSCQDRCCVFFCLMFPQRLLLHPLPQVHSFMCNDFHEGFSPIAQHDCVFLATLMIWIDREIWEMFFAANSHNNKETLFATFAHAIRCTCKDASVKCVFAVSYMDFQPV